MKKVLLILLVLAAVLLAVAACSGISGQSPVANNDNLTTDCDLSGDYAVVMPESPEGHNCTDYGDAVMTVVQSGSTATVNFAGLTGFDQVGNGCWDMLAEGTVDCDTRTITATTTASYGYSTVTITVTISESGEVSGTIECDCSYAGGDIFYTGTPVSDSFDHCHC